jgi:hypothetical protein
MGNWYRTSPLNKPKPKSLRKPGERSTGEQVGHKGIRSRKSSSDNQEKNGSANLKLKIHDQQYPALAY